MLCCWYKDPLAYWGVCSPKVFSYLYLILNIPLSISFVIMDIIQGQSNQSCPSEDTPLLRNESTYQHTSYHYSCYKSVTNQTSKDEICIRSRSSSSSVPAGLEVDPLLGHVLGDSFSSHDPDTPSDKEEYAARFIDVSPARFWVIFGGVLCGYILGFFDTTLMSSSHPVITSYFNAANSASWLSTVFLLTSTAFMPLFGRISDTFGRKPVYLFSITMFFLTTAGCGLAPNIGSFIAARAFCGLGAGGIISLGQIISSDLVHLEYRGVYQSYLALSLGTGSSMGLAFGGFLCDHIGWRGAFLIQLPLIFIYLVVAAWTVPADLGIKRVGMERMTVSQLIRNIDLTGALILAVCVTALIMGLNLGGNVFPWRHPLIIISLVTSLVLAVLLVHYERQVERPVLPIELMLEDPRASLNLGIFFSAICIHTVIFNAPLYFQAVKLISPTDSGLRLFSTSVALTISSGSVGFMINRTRRLKPFIVVGSLLIMTGGLASASLGTDSSEALAMVSLSFASLGQGLAWPTMTVSMLATSEQTDQAVALTTMGLWRSLGGVMGVAVSSWIFQNSLRYQLEYRVTGVEKEYIVALVRKSVQTIADLDPVHRLEGMLDCP